MRFAGASCLALAALGAATSARAAGPDDELVVTASRSGEGVRADLLGGSVSIVEAGDLQARQARLVSDLLRDIPGVAVSRAGPEGGLTQVRIRGAESNHTVVLIDGMLASDPAQGEFDFAGLATDEAGRIEVLRGQQSALYGSNAIGGVIQYITLSGREAPGLRGMIEGGSFNGLRTSARYGVVAGPLDLAVAAGYSTTDGSPGARLGVRDLDAKTATASAKAVFAPADNFRLVVAARYAETHADTNPSDYASPSSPSFGRPVDGADFYASRQRMGLVRAEGELFDRRWAQSLAFQTNHSQRRSFSDVGRPSVFSNGTRDRLSYVSALRLGDGPLRQSLTAAVDVERLGFRNLPLTATPTAQNLLRHIRNTGVMGAYDLSWNDRLGLGASARHDANSRFRNATTYRIQGSYRFRMGTRLRAAAGSGVTNPTFIELFGYDPAYLIGNPALRPEKSEGWEIGADQGLLQGRASLGITYFRSRLRGEIFTAFTPSFVSTPANRTTLSKQHGIELTGSFRLGPQWRADAAFTRLRATENGVQEIRRPDTTASVNLVWRAASDRFGAALTVRYNGPMTDTYFGVVTETKRLSAFTLVNLAADWRIGPRLQLFGRIENATGARYEEVYGYRTAGRTAYAGVRAAL